MPPKTLNPESRVVRLTDYQDRRLLLEEFAQKRRSNVDSDTTSNVVSLSDRVVSFGSIEIDEISALTPKSQREAVMTLVREHLEMEFGHLRITQTKRTFVVQHRNIEELIGALLRVQYHVFQCTDADLRAVGVQESFASMNLTWGVGGSVVDADAERLKRRRRKRYFTPSW